MTYPRHLLLSVALSLSLPLMGGLAHAQVQPSRPFDQRGPTGDNRAAAGHPATQLPPSELARDNAEVNRVQKQRRASEGPAKSERPAHAPTFTTPGTPAEDDNR